MTPRVIAGFRREVGETSALLSCYATNSGNFLPLLTFIGPCILIYSYSKTNKMHLLSQIVYSCTTLYMFRTVFPSIIRSSRLHIQQRYMSNSCCYLLLAAGSSSCLTYSVVVCAVLSS